MRAVGTTPAVTGGNGETRRSRLSGPLPLPPWPASVCCRHDPDACGNIWGYGRKGQTWRYDRRPSLPRHPVVLGMLYAREPDAFGPAVADLLREGGLDRRGPACALPALRPRPAPEPS